MATILRPKLCALFAAVFCWIQPARADVIYDFKFTNLLGITTYADFEVTLDYPTFVTTTGLMPLPGAPVPTSLGFDITSSGTSLSGQWGFDGLGLATLSDLGFLFDAASLVIDLSGVAGAYITTPGTYTGTVLGNAFLGHGFRGDGTLTVTDMSQVPEPSALSLMGLWLLALSFTVVQRRRETKQTCQQP